MKKVNLELGHNKKIFLVSPNITLDELFSYFRPFMEDIKMYIMEQTTHMIYILSHFVVMIF